jgi:hypothetical protein
MCMCMSKLMEIFLDGSFFSNYSTNLNRLESSARCWIKTLPSSMVCVQVLILVHGLS